MLKLGRHIAISVKPVLVHYAFPCFGTCIQDEVIVPLSRQSQGKGSWLSWAHVALLCTSALGAWGRTCRVWDVVGTVSPGLYSPATVPRTSACGRLLLLLSWLPSSASSSSARMSTSIGLGWMGGWVDGSSGVGPYLGGDRSR